MWGWGLYYSREQVAVAGNNSDGFEPQGLVWLCLGMRGTYVCKRERACHIAEERDTHIC